MILVWAPGIDEGHEGEESWGLNWRGDGTYPLSTWGGAVYPLPRIFLNFIIKMLHLCAFHAILCND